MAIFKCKMCGGSLEISADQHTAVCEYCGTEQTLPRLDDDRKANLYDRANHFRRNNDFDKAMGIYENILNEDSTDAEAYWSLVLCRYGIEYVEDPATHKRIPTVNRAQFTSIFDDDNYKSALQYADEAQRRIYEQEAQIINEIQKGILAISQKEKPFDVFICYKETDQHGRRTPDSVLANELYYQLKQEGFKVFFARITLEDKLGTAYEPYIFAALNSAKAMVVLGTKPEYFNAVWVKNEWSRYLSIVKASKGKKVLIPAYRDMDPYDLPEEFSHLQAQDMSKLGFMQDLIRGIKKIIKADESKTAVVQQTVVSGNTDITPLLKRAFMFLEDRDWNSANEYCEKVLDIDPECAEAYLGKLMAELRCSRQAALQDQAEPFEKRNNYEKVIRFADAKLKADIENSINYIYYRQAKSSMDAAACEDDFKHAADLFQAIAEYEDAASQAEKCLEQAEIKRKDAIYDAAQKDMLGDKASAYEYECAILKLKKIPGWKDASEQIIVCQNKIKQIQEQEELRRQREEKQNKRNKKIAMIVIPIICVCIAYVSVQKLVIKPSQKLEEVNALIESGDYVSAYALLNEMGRVDLIAESKDNLLHNAQVGDVVFFGAYEQDNDSANGKEDIEWQVLDKQGDKILLISKYALDCKPYNTQLEAITWEKCPLRKWLNDDFLHAAFTSEEQKMIPTMTVSADRNSGYDIDPGNDTEDKIFLLSIPEADRYFSSPDAMVCKPTPYTMANGTFEADNESRWWWLRSPGSRFDFCVANVGKYGGVERFGEEVDKAGAVRPAMWVNLES